MGEALRALVDSLYTRLVLRDFAGKVVPGAIALLALGGRLTPALDLIANWQLPSVVLVALGTGAAWITALALQSLGEVLGVIRYWPPNLENSAARYELRLRFSQLASSEDKQQAERFTIILEACALSSMALLFVAAIALSYVFFPRSEEVARWRSVEAYVLIPVLVGAALVLWRSHKAHRDKLYDFIRKACELRGPAPASPTTMLAEASVTQRVS